jgi:hypothetical protein
VAAGAGFGRGGGQAGCLQHSRRSWRTAPPGGDRALPGRAYGRSANHWCMQEREIRHSNRWHARSRPVQLCDAHGQPGPSHHTHHRSPASPAGVCSRPPAQLLAAGSRCSFDRALTQWVAAGWDDPRPARRPPRQPCRAHRPPAHRLPAHYCCRSGSGMGSSSSCTRPRCWAPTRWPCGPRRTRGPAAGPWGQARGMRARCGVWWEGGGGAGSLLARPCAVIISACAASIPCALMQCALSAGRVVGRVPHVLRPPPPGGGG